MQIFLPFHLIDGLDEVQNGSFLVYPNPAKGIAWLENPGGAETEIQVCDMLGQVLRTMQPDPAASGDLPIDLNGLPAGVYSVRVRSGTRLTGEVLLVVLTR